MKAVARFWNNLPIARKLLLEITLTTVALFSSNLLIYTQINKMVQRMDSVYLSNVNLSELSERLVDVQNYMYRYLEVKDSKSLTDYYRAEQEYRKLLEDLNTKITENPIQILEKNIRNMSESYLRITDEAVQAKRGLNIERYKSLYESAFRQYQFINSNISILNSQQFKNNTASYLTLQAALHYLEIVCLIMLVIVMLISLSVMMMITRGIVTPLTNLAQTAELVGRGDFHVKVAQIDSGDELGIVTRTFNQMVDSLANYVNQIKAGAEKEQMMREREFLMETHLKEAQLKYLQSQINPHFLFNSLNAGVQLAVIEEAEKTSVFLERMADFFRYNVKKGTEDTTIREELKAVENYIYILNVRFAGDIKYSSQIDEEVLGYRIPSMILQPLVENAVNHGIRGVDWEGRILLQIKDTENGIRIIVRDNGQGMTAQQLQVLTERGRAISGGDSTGIGIENVITRLQLYYNRKQIFQIASEGLGKGTTVELLIPKEGGNADVSDLDS